MTNTKCFISAPSTYSQNKIKEILNNLSIEIVDVYSIPISSNIVNDIKLKIQEADFVLAILYHNNSNVLIEIGMSQAIGKPIFILNINSNDLPFNLQLVPQIIVDPDKIDDIKFPISSFISSLKQSKYSKRRSIKSSLPKLSDINSFINEISMIRKNGNEQQLANFASKYFDYFRVQFFSSTQQINTSIKRIDFVIWVNELEQIMKNPFLVEIKRGNISESLLENAENQLINYMESSKTSSALLLYLDVNGKRFPSKSLINPMIIRYDFEDLIKLTSTCPLHDAILNLRNTIVHGGDNE